MKKKILTLILAGVLALSTVACGNKTDNTAADTNSQGETAAPAANNGDKIEVTILGNIKTEVATQFEEARQAYNASQDKYELVSIPLDGNAFEKMTSLYASGNAPTIMTMGQEVAEFSDKLLDISDQPLLQQAQEGSYDVVTKDGKVLGFPLTVEAFGILYNKAVLDEVTGGTFDPATIDSRSALEDLYTKIEAAGKGAVDICPIDWSLGAHLTNLMFAPQGDKETALKLMDSLKAGEADLAGNTVFNGWLDTFDLLKAHNISKDSPLAPTYDEAVLRLADGEVATWFQGNWTLPMIQEIDPEARIGILPYPVSDNPEDYGNTQISVGVPLYFAIDASQSSPEQQAGALDFINWFFTSEAGQKSYVQDMKLIPIYDSVKLSPDDYLSQSISNYLKDGKTLDWINIYYPGDGSSAMGASMQKYLDGSIAREELAAELEDYWKGKK